MGSSVSTQANLDWTATDERAVDLIRVLAMDRCRKQRRTPGYGDEPAAADSLFQVARHYR